MLTDEQDLELMASALYRLVENRPWIGTTEHERHTYTVLCRQYVEHTKAEKAQQPHAGQKEVA